MSSLYGLIGKTLQHSFSQKYFRNKFSKEAIKNSDYQLFELAEIQEFTGLLAKYPELCGLNVTIPYKLEVIPFLDEIDSAAKEIGAVNTIKFKSAGGTIGYNTDYLGFKISLQNWLQRPFSAHKALVLGTGGASKAVVAALKDLGLHYKYVSRTASENAYSYQQLKATPDIMREHLLVINTTPLGTSPNVDAAPDIPYEMVTDQHYFYDLVYNPAETLFLKEGKMQGAKIKNGLQMLELQAEKAWEIWNS